MSTPVEPPRTWTPPKCCVCGFPLPVGLRHQFIVSDGEPDVPDGLYHVDCYPSERQAPCLYPYCYCGDGAPDRGCVASPNKDGG